jgi:hypothetical protein
MLIIYIYIIVINSHNKSHEPNINQNRARLDDFNKKNI